MASSCTRTSSTTTTAPRRHRPIPATRATTGDSFSRPNGTYTYPTDPVYADNAADLVELRVKPLAAATAFRVTLNTMKDPKLVGTTIAIGGSPQPREFPHGANASAPASLFLTVHGTHADLVDAATGKPVTPAPRVTVSTIRRQIDVRVPHGAWNPGHRSIRLAAGVGLWNPAANRYLVPGAAADATHPGGAAGLAIPRHSSTSPSVTRSHGSTRTPRLGVHQPRLVAGPPAGDGTRQWRPEPRSTPRSTSASSSAG